MAICWRWKYVRAHHFSRSTATIIVRTMFVMVEHSLLFSASVLLQLLLWERCSLWRTIDNCLVSSCCCDYYCANDLRSGGPLLFLECIYAVSIFVQMMFSRWDIDYCSMNSFCYYYCRKAIRSGGPLKFGQWICSGSNSDQMMLHFVEQWSLLSEFVQAWLLMLKWSLFLWITDTC